MNIPMRFTQIIKSFLTNRSVRVWKDDQLSSPGSILVGVFQGSRLAPVQYLIYTNDIPDTSKAFVVPTEERNRSITA